MKILMLTPYLPYPPASGGQIRTLNLLKYLSQENEITLVSLYKNQKEKQYADELKGFCKNIYLCKRAEKPWQIGNIARAIFTFFPFLVVRNFSVEAKKIIAHLLSVEKFDVIHAETFYIMPHIPKTNVPILLVEQTIEYKVYQHFLSTMPAIVRTILTLDILKLKYWERYYWRKAAVVSAVSEADRETIMSIEPTILPVVIPNGAGDDMFSETIQEKNLKNPKILFMGNFYWLQNVEAAQYLIQNILPHIIKTLPAIEIIIAGQNAKQKIQVTQDKHVTIVNIAPDDTKTVKKLYDEATIFVAPIFGPGGTRLKILASMASGLPVVSTQTGIEGLGVEDGKHVLIAHSPLEFGTQITTMLSDKNLYGQIQKNAYQLVKKNFSWSAISKKLEVVYKKLITI